MSWRKRMRMAAMSVAAIAVGWAVVALAARAQNPQQLPPVPPPSLFPGVGPLEPTKPEEKALPKLVLPAIEDPNVEPVQYTRPVAGGTVTQPLTRPGMSVPDPPHPVVRIQVRVPADAAPGEDLRYIITVQNVSSADAHSVTVRNPLPPEVETVVKAEPLPDKEDPTDKRRQLVWSLGTLKAGTSRTIELTLRPKDGITELKNLAYVKYEHGQAVTTKIAKPTIKVTKSAPKQSVRDETYTVRIFLENTGKVPAESIRVIENAPASAEIEPVTKGANRIAQAEGQQWVWVIAKIQPGERKVIEYRITPRESKDVFTLTSVTGTKLVSDKPTEARTQVLVPGLTVTLTGPTGVVNAGESAKYEIVVKNTGTLPCARLKITGTIPPDCKPTMKTDGGQLYRDSIVWQLPRLEPGEAQSYRFAFKASTTGRRVVVASASDARGQRASQELATVFQGAAALSWETKFDPLTVAVGRQGTFTVKVKNTGGESARNVRVQVDVPDAVTVVQTTPNVRVTNGTVVFASEAIPAYGESTYTITFQGAKADQAWFRVRMSADALGDNPMKTEKMVEVIGNPR
ncbi:MAG: DUF11 domain-containing protein [Planctomycetia bacterium]|nr:DUF11 domain-containing protein [Planctomycetia bacterium]